MNFFQSKHTNYSSHVLKSITFVKSQEKYKMLDRFEIPLPLERDDIRNAYRIDEKELVTTLIKKASLSEAEYELIRKKALSLVDEVRKGRKKNTGIDSFLTEFSLTSEEGVALMCLAEALLRVPDNSTIDELIRDKLASKDWSSHLGQSDSFFVNAATWALMLTGKVLAPERASSVLTKPFMRLINRSSEGVIRKATEKAMRIMSKQFVMGRTIDEAIERAKKKEAKGYRYSYDMLGEAAITEEDALRYFHAYEKAIQALEKNRDKSVSLYDNAGISIKLSALYPRYQESEREKVLEILVPRLLSLALLAKRANVPMTVDAEESERLELSMDVIEAVFRNDALSNWDGFGMAVQSYQKRAFFLLDWVYEIAKKAGRRMNVRLIKGAYWDSEIKKSQMNGFPEYPVFTKKVFTDISFQACAKKLLTMTDFIYPQFATHNAYSVAMILSIVGDYRDFEFQCLHGMGDELYQQIVPEDALGIPCRIYAPVGSHEDLLPYLVRRLLENGANSSFVNRIVDDAMSTDSLVENPVEKAKTLLASIHSNISLPRDIYPHGRINSAGIDLSSRKERSTLKKSLSRLTSTHWEAHPLIAHREHGQVTRSVTSPQDTSKAIGHVSEATPDEVEAAIKDAEQTFETWSRVPVRERGERIKAFADSLEKNRDTLFAMLCLEAGKTWNDSIAEVREAVDFCRYYADEAIALMESPKAFQGYTGESNELWLHPRGPILCISPWNFPLAIFTGQVVAALVTGNTVLAKPAEQTPLIAAFATNLMHEAGIPKGAIQLLPGRGEVVGAAMVRDTRVKGVIFTGSTQTARIINETLATRGGAIVPFIAETGGQNAMIVDSSALPEQVVMDAMLSAFGSAGQRCSALRVLYIQEEIYPRIKFLLQGAMTELKVGLPQYFDTDVGPVIDADALAVLEAHVKKMRARFEVIYQCELPKECKNGYFLAPIAIEIDSMKSLDNEVFGPVLHVIPYAKKDLDKVIDEINSTGYGLTFGIHSRITERVRDICSKIKAGNCYVNRSMTGAVVGLQPFGGEGLSGTGPKAGGPHYLHRLCVERTITIDTTAAGGNATLMSLPE